MLEASAQSERNGFSVLIMSHQVNMYRVAQKNLPSDGININLSPYKTFCAAWQSLSMELFPSTDIMSYFQLTAVSSDPDWLTLYPCYVLVHISWRLFNLVLFIISLSDYNLVLLEDNLTNRIRESEKLFGEILNCIFFRETPFIVFFNKVDIFSEKLKSLKIGDFLPEYSGSQELEEAM